VNKLLSTRVLILSCIAYWLVWSAMHVYILLQLGFTTNLAIADSLINNFILADCCAAIIITLKWYQPGRSNSFLLLIWIAGLAKICSILTNLALSYFFSDKPEYLSFLHKTLLVRISIAFLVISCVAIVRWLYNSYKERQYDTDKQKEAERLLKEAELTGLRQQLQPHFLFNSLNSISALAGTKPEESRKMIQQLSDFLRGTLKKDDQQLRPLKDELIHLQLYLDIEKVRFGHRLKTEISCDEKSNDLLLPPLLLQPIVENAIKFGLYDTVGEITVHIRATSESGNLLVSISNPFDSQTAQPRRGTGFGLSSVQRRLYLIFSRNDLLQVNHTEDLFTTTVKIPQHT
jgi:two-component system LytT family sensor kinase